MCPKCGSKNVYIYYSGGRYIARCMECFWHGLQDSLKRKNIKKLLEEING